MRKSLSIIIPAYNEERHIVACLDAIAVQTEMPDEVIVVDNNSVDKTVEIARRYPFVTVVPEPRQGRVYARDKGFDAAKSEIIGRIDADTILPVHWVKYLKDFYADEAHAAVAWTGGGYFYNLHFARTAGWAMGQVAYRMNRFIMGHYILWGSNMAIPRAVWQTVKPLVCHRNDIHEDLDLAIHVHRSGYTITYHEGEKVGVEMRRVFVDRHELWENLQWWPRTLKVHHNKMWIAGSIGAVCLFSAWPLLWLLEKLVALNTRPGSVMRKFSSR